MKNLYLEIVNHWAAFVAGAFVSWAFFSPCFVLLVLWMQHGERGFALSRRRRRARPVQRVSMHHFKP